MIVLQVILCAIAASALGGVICRLDKLQWKTHLPSVILMHIGLGLSSAWALYSFTAADFNPGAFGAIVGTVSWLWVSLQSWKDGKPPAWTERTPDDGFTRAQYASLVGVRKDE